MNKSHSKASVNTVGSSVALMWFAKYIKEEQKEVIIRS
jgi:hypothetical protein